MRRRRHNSAGHRPRLRWLLGVAGLAVAGATMLSLAPAQAATTVGAQLTLTGVTTSSSPLGGSVVGVHPGDTVHFTAGAFPTAGLSSVPALGSVLQQVTNGLNGQYQVVVSFGSAFPGGAKTVTLGGPSSGACAGERSATFTFPNLGTYNFTWKVQYVLPVLLGCSKSGLSAAELNQLASAGVKLNASNSWVGQVVVANNPPPGGISLQLPGLSAAPNIAGQQLPTLGIPGIVLPTITLGVPNLNSGGAGSGSGGAGSGTNTAPGPGDTAVIPVPALVVPGGPNLGNVGGGGFSVPAMPRLNSQQLGNGGGNSGLLPVSNGSAAAAVANVPGGAKQPAPRMSPAKQTVDLASSNKSSAGQLSVVLAILAIIALTLVAATYARLYLLRR